jgi:hypothetical protein
MKNEINKIWNQAVNNTWNGETRATRTQSERLIPEFFKLAKKAGLQEKECREYAKESQEALGFYGIAQRCL